MSLFYDYMKGVNQAGNFYTRIKWNTDDSPVIEVATDTNFTKPTSYGKIICADKTNSFTGKNTFTGATQVQTLSLPSGNNYLTAVASDNNSIVIGGGTDDTWTSINFSKQVNLQAALIGTAATFNGQCSAHTFNALSDLRAKKDISDISSNALDIIKNIPLHTFTFKDTNARSFGVIAQEVMDFRVNGVSLVENRDATGVNGDYMRVNESRLIYLLIKAVQEQQEKIDTLTTQLDNIKKTRN